jgi:hypothetical protein
VSGIVSGDDDAHEDGEATPRERAKRLVTRLRFLRMRERSANFEDLEAIHREIHRTEEELARLADEGGFEVDIEVRHGR